jgi:hypothetical protein
VRNSILQVMGAIAGRGQESGTVHGVFGKALSIEVVRTGGARPQGDAEAEGVRGRLRARHPGCTGGPRC